MKKIKYLLLVTAMAFALIACGEKEEPVEPETEKTTEETTEVTTNNIFGFFDTQTLEGEDVTEEIFTQADLTMVNIWGTYCGPCINEMPDLGEISREYKDKGFQIVGMICDVTESGDETALQIVEETHADYMHIVASDDLQSGILQYVTGVPTTFFVDKNGNMVGEAYVGARDKASWEILINNLLEGVQ